MRVEHPDLEFGRSSRALVRCFDFGGLPRGRAARPFVKRRLGHLAGRGSISLGARSRLSWRCGTWWWWRRARRRRLARRRRRRRVPLPLACDHDGLESHLRLHKDFGRITSPVIMTDAIRGHERASTWGHSWVNQRSSGVIRSHQEPYLTFESRRPRSYSSGVIRSHQESSGVIRSHISRLRVEGRGLIHQESSGVIRSHQESYISHV